MKFFLQKVVQIFHVDLIGNWIQKAELNYFLMCC